jgi:hypothetical protein
LLKKYIAAIHTGGLDIKLLQDGKQCISLNYDKIIIIYFGWSSVPFYSTLKQQTNTPAFESRNGEIGCRTAPELNLCSVHKPI